jgi:hypothetical protein
MVDLGAHQQKEEDAMARGEIKVPLLKPATSHS